MKSLFWNTLYPFVRGVFLSLFLFINTIFAQPWKRPEVSSKWYFGAGAGLEFINGIVSRSYGSLCAQEGNSTICDSSGNLLFYTDGIKVYNKNHLLMQNGDSLGAGQVVNLDCAIYKITDNSSASQGALILPMFDSLYRIITTSCCSNTQQTMYSVVDMAADSGRGAVIQKNVLVYTSGIEKQASVRHANGKDWWHLFHLANSDSFGVSYIDTNFHVNFQKSGSYIVGGQAAYSQMKFNWNGDLLVNLIQTSSSQVNFDFFHFDRCNGKLSYISTLSQDLENQISSLFSKPYIYSACFSPNGEFLYFSVSENLNLTFIFQYKIRSKDLISIYSSNNFSCGEFQIANNGVIYVAQGNSCVLPAIQSPDLPYPACGFTLNGVATQIPVVNCTRQSNLGLQNAAVFADPELTADLSVAQGQGCGEVVFTDSSGGHFYRLWDFGDGTWSDTLPVVQSAEFLGILDTFQVVHHTYTDTGWFQVRLFLLHSDTLSDTLTQWIHISNCQLTNLENEHFCPQSPEIQVYPNPSSGILNVRSSTVCSLSLHDLTGRQLLQSPPNTLHELNLKDLAKGVYLLEIETNGKREVRKVVKE